MITSAETEPKDIYRRIIEAISHDDSYALERFVAPDVVDHNPIPGQAAGVDGFKQWMASTRISFPDLLKYLCKSPEIGIRQKRKSNGMMHHLNPRSNDGAQRVGRLRQFAFARDL